MRLRPGTSAILLLSAATAAAAMDETKTVSGRVADEAGRPAPGVTVAPIWIANGLRWDRITEVQKRGKTEELWQNEGDMEPLGERLTTTDADGRFSITIHERERSLIALDGGRRRGALITPDPGRPGALVEAGLRPLVRVTATARLAGAETPLEWSCVYLNLPFDEKDPLARRRIAICGSYKSRAVFLVPPGDYVLTASSDSPSAQTVEGRPFTVTAGPKEVDLGALVLRPMVPFQARIDRAKARGTWGNYKEHFGHRPPPWHLTDARGVSRDATLADFRGKWVVFYIWSPYCSPCLGKELPELMAFYEAHKSRRDKFEVLAFCCDFSETLKDVKALERQLEPVRKAVWGGKALPFPVLLDNTFQTYERFGLEGSGASNLLLIDPAGKLVEGDLKTLTRELARPREAAR